MPHSHAESSQTQEALFRRITHRIRQSLELQEILSATVAEVRSFLGTDRVKIYQFKTDGSGIVIAESIKAERLPPLLGLHFPADDIPPYARELFVRARQRSVVDLTSHEIGISPLSNAETGEMLSPQDIRYRPVDPCHVEYLTAMGVKSSVVVPIVLENKETGRDQLDSRRESSQLWGLLVSHHSEPRAVGEAELQFIQSVVDQVSIAIAQSVLLKQVQEQAQQEADINRVTSLLYTIPTVELQPALEEAVAVFQGWGGRLYLLPTDTQKSELYECGEQPQKLDLGKGRPMEENLLWQRYLHSGVGLPNHENSTKPWSVKWMRAVYALANVPSESATDSNIWAIRDIYQEPLFRALAPSFQFTKIRGLLSIPLQYGQQIVGCLTIFRTTVNTEIMWAGCNDTDTRQLMPRQSFEAWRELKTGAQEWTEGELKLAQALGERFSNAVKQYQLYQQVQGFNASLETQVREQTAELRRSNIELKQSADQQKALFSIIWKMRESWDLEAIFQMTTQEVCHLLQTSRVAVYRFNEDWGGQFVGDFEAANSDGTLLTKLGTNPVWDDTYLQETQGGRYRHNQTSVVEDIYNTGYTSCHIEILEQFQIRAFAIAPIFIGQQLWGLLGAYHDNTRLWENTEVDFLKQIATQLGIALQQGEYLLQVQTQAKQLTLFAEQQQTLASVINKIRSSLKIDKIFAATTREVCSLLNVDRVAVFQFYSESHKGGEIVAEDVKPGVPSIFSAKVYDRCLNQDYVQKYRNGQIQAITDIENSGLNPCYIQMLSHLQIRANLIVPMLQEDQLWGLLCIHQCHEPRHWQASEIEFATQIAAQLSIALKHATLLAQTHQQTQELSETLTDLKQTQTHLIHSEKMSSLGQLVAGVAHEINNPVNFIYGNLTHIEEYCHNLLKFYHCYQQHTNECPQELLHQAESLDLDFLAEDIPQLIGSLKLGASRIRSLVLSLRNFSRLDEAEVKAVNIHEGIDSTLLILQHRLKASPNHPEIQVVKNYGDLPLVECFASQLNQVFMNLLANAIDALQEQDEQIPKTITISTQSLPSNWVKIQIADNGIGIPEDVQKKLFDPFFTTKPIGKGTGLGLSISYQIIDKHNGTLKCSSKLTQGTKFVIEIPTKQN